MLKTHLAHVHDLNYEDFAIELPLGSALDDEVEAITKRCDGGSKPVACVWGRPPPPTAPPKYLFYAFLASALLLGFSLSRVRRRRKAPRRVPPRAAPRRATAETKYVRACAKADKKM